MLLFTPRTTKRWSCSLLIWAMAMVPMAQAQPNAPWPTACADLSVLDELQQAGALYRGAQGVADPLRLLREQGLNMVRLRLWHTPAAGQDGLREVLAMAERVDAQGLDLMLTIHYSDTWADPSQQAKPALWQGQPFSALRDSVRSYTERTVRALVDQGTSPALIQIGNEITGGMLWPEGRVGGAYDTPAQWRQLADLLQAGIDGVRAADDQVATMLHVDNGGSAETVRWFFDNIRNAGVDFDVIGLSYYPWWHGTLADLADTLATAAERYQRPVMVVETAYPWTLDWFDTTHNIVGLPEQLLAGFPASPEGQAAFIAAVRQAVADVKDGLGQGICYWAPEHLATTSVGSPWENLALFDDTGMLLPGAAALGGRPSTVAVGVPAAASAAVTVHPNPVASQLTMRLTTAAPVCPEVTVYTALGQIQAQTSLACGVGERQAVMDTSTWPPGVYLYTVVASDAVRHRGMFTVMR